MSDGERKVLELYEGARPRDEELFETSNVNHLAWSLVVILFGLVLWLCIALVNAENQRHALMTNKCPDPVFKNGVDKACLYTVRSRDHWWEHLWYAFTHVNPEPK
ncbi:hypothetical protein ACFPOU_13845 [Massilia jejuensis]|uniref:Uncharacterized protein n=1 Tax=Massilia jejuensis TaxID=648894 RepID=A0ABW0PIB6_9BURK